MKKINVLKITRTDEAIEMTILIQKNQQFTDLLQRNLMSEHEQNRRVDNTVHVSDIIPTTCIRKQYYSRKFPIPRSNESVHHFVRGESSEYIITQLADTIYLF
jgi:hypothetical protein